ncbi:VCP-like ATPase [uncultured archaeon]|nr:VCP-like ATPase [uncultured archaeon]
MASGPGKPGEVNRKAKELYDEAGKLFEQNDFEGAVRLYTDAIGKEPDYASAYFNRALAYAILNKYGEATDDANKVLQIEPDSCDAPYVMGIINEYKHDNAKAVEWYEKSLKSNPNYEQAKTRLAALKEKMGTPGAEQARPAEKAKETGNKTVTEEGQIKSVKWFTSDSTFADLAGMKKEKEIIHDNIILALTKPELLKAYGKKLGMGVLFYGPPGCGKTQFVRAIAGETKSKFIVANINEIVDMYAGNTEKNMHAIFEQARKNTPCIIFFDEVDALGTKREGEQQSTMRMAVNQFLQELDGVEKNPEGIFVVTATNQPWDVDPALKRAGRLGQSIYVPQPDYKTRKAAFAYHTRKMPIEKGLNLGRLARATMGYSQADITEICDKTALKVAAEEDRTGVKRPIKMGDFRAIIKKTPTTLDEWYSMVKKDIISKTETQVVDGKKQEIVKEGKLSAEEKARYKDLIGDVKKNSSELQKLMKKFMRFWAMYLF